MRLNSFMSWIGGKKALRELIVTLFPLYYERYIEVFGGGGWVLFHKSPGNDFEVYNDFNSLLVNLYRCVRDKPQELMESLRYVLNSREDFDAVRAILARDSPASDVQKAAWFYELIRYSYAAGLTSFGSQPHDMGCDFWFDFRDWIRLSAGGHRESTKRVYCCQSNFDPLGAVSFCWICRKLSSEGVNGKAAPFQSRRRLCPV